MRCLPDIPKAKASQDTSYGQRMQRQRRRSISSGVSKDHSIFHEDQAKYQPPQTAEAYGGDRRALGQAKRFIRPQPPPTQSKRNRTQTIQHADEELGVFGQPQQYPAYSNRLENESSDAPASKGGWAQSACSGAGTHTRTLTRFPTGEQNMAPKIDGGATLTVEASKEQSVTNSNDQVINLALDDGTDRGRQIIQQSNIDEYQTLQRSIIASTTSNEKGTTNINLIVAMPRERHSDHQSSAQPKQVQIKNLEFEGNKPGKYKNTIDDQRTTFKLPSYASCLRAQIRPKNFTALKDYYELLAKDADMAKVNEKQFFNAAKEKIQHKQKRANSSLDWQQASLQNYVLFATQQQDLFNNSKPNPFSRSIEMQESYGLNPMRRSSIEQQYQFRTESPLQPVETEVRKRDKVIKYQFALKNPRLLMQKDVKINDRDGGGEMSAGTFKKDKDGSDLNPGSSRTAYHPMHRIIEFGSKLRTSSQMQQQRMSLDESVIKQDHSTRVIQEAQAVIRKRGSSPNKAISQSMSQKPQNLSQNNYALLSEHIKSLESGLKNPDLGTLNADVLIPLEPDDTDDYAIHQYTFENDEGSRRQEDAKSLMKLEDSIMTPNQYFDASIDQEEFERRASNMINALPAQVYQPYDNISVDIKVSDDTKKRVFVRNEGMKNCNKSNISKTNDGVADGQQYQENNPSTVGFKQSNATEMENSLIHLTDKQAAATFKTNDFFSEAENDAENDLESFTMEKKILSSGHEDATSPANQTFSPEQSATMLKEQGKLKTRVLKYKVPNFPMPDTYKSRDQAIESNTAQNSAANISTMRQSDSQPKSPFCLCAQRESMTKTQDVTRAIKPSQGTALRRALHSQNVSKRSNMYQDIRNRTAVPTSNQQTAEPLSMPSKAGFDVTKSTQQDVRDSLDDPQQSNAQISLYNPGMPNILVLQNQLPDFDTLLCDPRQQRMLLDQYLNSQFGKRSIKTQEFKFDASKNRQRYGKSVEPRDNLKSGIQTRFGRLRKPTTPGVPNRLVKQNAYIKKSVKDRRTSSEFAKEKALNERKPRHPTNQSEIDHWLQTHRLRSLLSIEKDENKGKSRTAVVTDSKGVQVNVQQLVQRVSPLLSRTSVDNTQVEYNTEPIPIQNVVVPNAFNSLSQENLVHEAKKQCSHSTLAQAQYTTQQEWTRREIVERVLKQQNRSRSTTTSNSQSQNAKRVKRRGDYTEGFYSTFNAKKGTSVANGKNAMIQEEAETMKEQQSVKNRKDKAASTLVASLPSALTNAEKHEFVAVIAANNLPGELQVLLSPHIQDLNADLTFEQRSNTMDYMPHIPSTEPEFLQALSSPAWAKMQQAGASTQQASEIDAKPFEIESAAYGQDIPKTAERDSQRSPQRLRVASATADFEHETDSLASPDLLNSYARDRRIAEQERLHKQESLNPSLETYSILNEQTVYIDSKNQINKELSELPRHIQKVELVNRLRTKDYQLTTEEGGAIIKEQDSNQKRLGAFTSHSAKRHVIDSGNQTDYNNSSSQRLATFQISQYSSSMERTSKQNQQLAFQAHRRLRKNDTSPLKETPFAKRHKKRGKKSNLGSRSTQQDQLVTGILPVEGKKTGFVQSIGGAVMVTSGTEADEIKSEKQRNESATEKNCDLQTSHRTPQSITVFQRGSRQGLKQPIQNKLNYTVPNVVSSLPSTAVRNSERKRNAETRTGTDLEKASQDYEDSGIQVQQQSIVKEEEEVNESSSIAATTNSNIRNVESNQNVNTCSKILHQEDLTLTASDLKRLTKHDLKANKSPKRKFGSPTFYAHSNESRRKEHGDYDQSPNRNQHVESKSNVLSQSYNEDEPHLQSDVDVNTIPIDDIEMKMVATNSLPQMSSEIAQSDSLLHNKLLEQEVNGQGHDCYDDSPVRTLKQALIKQEFQRTNSEANSEACGLGEQDGTTQGRRPEPYRRQEMSASVQVRKGELAAIIEKEHQVTASEGSEMVKPDAKHYDSLISDRSTIRNKASATQADIDVTDGQDDEDSDKNADLPQVKYIRRGRKSPTSQYGQAAENNSAIDTVNSIISDLSHEHRAEVYQLQPSHYPPLHAAGRQKVIVHKTLFNIGNQGLSYQPRKTFTVMGNPGMVHPQIEERSSIFEARRKQQMKTSEESRSTWPYDSGIKKPQATEPQHTEPADLVVEGSAPAIKERQLHCFASVSNVDKFYRGTQSRGAPSAPYNRDSRVSGKYLGNHCPQHEDVVLEPQTAGITNRDASIGPPQHTMTVTQDSVAVSQLEDSMSIDTYTRRGSSLLINKLVAHKVDHMNAEGMAQTAEISIQSPRPAEPRQPTPEEVQPGTQLRVSTLKNGFSRTRKSSVLTLNNGNLRPKQMSFQAVKRGYQRK